MVEVRRCPKCQQPAMLRIFERRVTASFSMDEAERTWRCQACGARALQKGFQQVLGQRWLGWILLPVLIGIPLLLRARHHGAFDQRVPVVPDAPVPELRFPDP